MNKEDVTHRGVVESAGIDSLTIRTEEACKCDGCALTALCTTKDGGHELLTIDTPLASDFAAGDRVEVTATSGSTLRATWSLSSAAGRLQSASGCLPSTISFSTVTGVSWLRKSAGKSDVYEILIKYICYTGSYNFLP